MAGSNLTDRDFDFAVFPSLRFFFKTKQNILFGFFGTSVPSRGLRVINEPVETMATASLDLKPLFHWFFFSMFVCVPPSFSVRRIRGPSISYQFKCDNQTRLNLSGSFLRPAQRFHFPKKKKMDANLPKKKKSQRMMCVLDKAYRLYQSINICVHEEINWPRTKTKH